MDKIQAGRRYGWQIEIKQSPTVDSVSWRAFICRHEDWSGQADDLDDAYRQAKDRLIKLPALCVQCIKSQSTGSIEA